MALYCGHWKRFDASTACAFTSIQRHNAVVIERPLNGYGAKYQAAVSANDSAAYRKLFATDAVRIPPGSEPEKEPDEIAASEQKD